MVGEAGAMAGANLYSIPIESGTSKKVSDSLNSAQRLTAYKKLAQKMRVGEISLDTINGTLSELEVQVDELQKMFSGLVPDKPIIREWLVKVINEQIEDKKPGELEGFKVKMGRDELDSLINANNNSIKYKVTEEAVRVLFGSRAVPLAEFIRIMKKEVLPFAYAVSPNNPLQKVLDLFAAHRFILISKEDMASGVKTALFNLARKSIEVKYESGEVDEGKRDELLKNIELYFKTGSDIVKKLILSENEDGEMNNKTGKKDPFDYFKDCRDSEPELFNIFNRVLFRSGNVDKYGVTAKNKEIDENNILYIVGLACLDELVSHLETTYGDRDDIYDISESKDPKVINALISASTDLALSPNGGWPNVRTVGPAVLTLKDYVHLLKTDQKTFFEAIGEQEQPDQSAKKAAPAINPPPLTNK